MLKPMPSLPPLCDAMAVLMPIELPVDVDQRAAAVAEIDRRVGLDEVLIDQGVFLRVGEPVRGH